MAFDWKFLATTLIAISGVVAPIWLWQSDQDSKSLTMIVVSKTPIATNNASQIDGLQFTFDKQPVSNLYITAIDLKNTGSKSIQKVDFDTPIEVKVGASTKILRVKVENVLPKDLNPSASFDQNSFKIAPLLLNPKDKMRISVISSNDTPSFVPASRISGVSEVVLIDNTTSSRQDNKKILHWGISVLLLTLYVGGFISTLYDLAVNKFNFIHAYVTIVSAFGGVAVMSATGDGQVIETYKILCAVIAAGVLSAPFHIKYAKISIRLIKERIFVSSKR